MNILNAAEAAVILDVSEQVVHKICRSGELQANKPGRSWRILESSIEEYLKGDHDNKTPLQASNIKWQSTNVAKRGISTSKATGSEYASLLTRKTSKKHKNSTTN